jgi:hypothetical protein
LRAQKLREEAAEKERDEHFNTIRPTFPAKQERRVKEKANTLALTTSDDDMVLLDGNKSLLVKGGSPPPIGMDINMLFTLLTEFRGAKEEVAQMCLGPKRLCSRSPMSRANTLSHCTFGVTSKESRSPGCSPTVALLST